MGLYNILRTTMTCPRCGEEAKMEVDLYFGFRNLIEYKIGDNIQWLPRKSILNGGRPANGNLKSEAYTQCPQCGKDFFVLANIREDVIQGAEADLKKKPYMPD